MSRPRKPIPQSDLLEQDEVFKYLGIYKIFSEDVVEVFATCHTYDNAQFNHKVIINFEIKLKYSFWPYHTAYRISPISDQIHVPHSRNTQS